MNKIRLAIIIPTRNRAKLAVATARSVLSSYSGEDIGVILSDNSSEAEEIIYLESKSFNKDRRLELIRPGASLGMTAHWNFAIDHAMANGDFTHFTIVTDRMIFKSEAINEIISIIKLFSRDVISYTYDRINDLAVPARYNPLPRSKKIIRIASVKLLQMSSQMSFPSCLPRMLNSVSPRCHLDELKQKSGAVFLSTAPDFSFCYRTLDYYDSIIFYDKSLLVNYAQARSNGGSFVRGVMTKDSRDFIDNLEDSVINNCSPLPALITVGNTIIHEYVKIKKISETGKFPDISMKSYMDFMASEVSYFENPKMAIEGLLVLRENGWAPTFSFRLFGIRRRIAQIILDVTSKKFTTVEKALKYSRNHRVSDWSWFPHPALRYGLDTGQDILGALDIRSS